MLCEGQHVQSQSVVGTDFIVFYRNVCFCDSFTGWLYKSSRVIKAVAKKTYTEQRKQHIMEEINSCIYIILNPGSFPL